MVPTAEVVIVGGGVTGTGIALHLAARGPATRGREPARSLVEYRRDEWTQPASPASGTLLNLAPPGLLTGLCAQSEIIENYAFVAMPIEKEAPVLEGARDAIGLPR
jgi:glycine/D-amino acid oxidase-like deaminating enzyme